MTLDLKLGELTGVVGPSGSGKTTFLLLAGLLDPPTRGEVCYRDEVVSHPRADLNRMRDLRRKQIGFVFQKSHLIPFLTAIENVEVAMQINDVRGRVARDRARDILHQLGMGHRIGSYPGQLSGGEQQRVSIARALANEPIVILADEPTAALDGERGLQVMTLLRQLADSRKVAVCVVTHDPRWFTFFDQTIRLSDGRLVGSKAQERQQLARLWNVLASES
jgi:putative ABC transport system ATP-binding protein